MGGLLIGFALHLVYQMDAVFLQVKQIPEFPTEKKLTLT